ncbi:MAG: hypothetical protein PHS92_02045 [Candidatus Gracilibacteria bacterium]|nr:hypothetical protein [Candidatus Gracilibacteria bacterium]
MEEDLIEDHKDTELKEMIRYSFLIDENSKRKLLDNPLNDEIRSLLTDFFSYYSAKEEEIFDIINQDSSKIITKMLDYIQSNDKEIELINIDNELLI